MCSAQAADLFDLQSVLRNLPVAPDCQIVQASCGIWRSWFSVVCVQSAYTRHYYVKQLCIIILCDLLLGD